MITKKTTILKFDDRGYGFSRDENENPLMVPYALPEEEVEIERKDHHWILKKIIKSNPQRISPPCPYYGTCGGCVLQHMSLEVYRDYKTDRILDSLNRYGLENIALEPLKILGDHLRRRAVFHGLRAGSDIHLGYYQLGSHTLVDTAHCLLLHPKINDLIMPLKLLLKNVLKSREKADIFLTMSETGCDLLLKVKGRNFPELSTLEVLKAFATTHDLARLTFSNEKEECPIATFRTPQVYFGKYAVDVSAEGFLQTSKEADELLTSLILRDLPSSQGKIADLFCGRGTFSVPLSEKGTVDAYEMDGKALDALKQATKRHKLSIKTQARNLFSDPLTGDELKFYQTIVLNPPRQGAAAQAKLLASSKVSHVVMVSCNPDTFARDIAYLIKGGFQIQIITPVDQFLWSPHVEIVAHLTR